MGVDWPINVTDGAVLEQHFPKEAHGIGELTDMVIVGCGSRPLGIGMDQTCRVR